MAASVPTLHSNAWTQSQGLNRWVMSGAGNSLRLQVKTWNSCRESLDRVQWLQSARKFKVLLMTNTSGFRETNIGGASKVDQSRAYFIAKLEPKLPCSRCLLIRHDLKERWNCLTEAIGCHLQGDITLYVRLFLKRNFRLCECFTFITTCISWFYFRFVSLLGNTSVHSLLLFL